MATVETIKLVNLVPGASATRLVTAPTKGHTVGSLTICNSNNASATFRFWIGNFAQSNAEVATRRAYDVTIAANTTVEWTSRISLPALGWIDVYGSTNTVSFAYSYVEVVQT